MSSLQSATVVLLAALFLVPAGTRAGVLPLRDATEQVPAGVGAPAIPSFGDSWHELGPPARAEHVAVFDQKRGRMVVFGGLVGRALRSDVLVLSMRPSTAWERVEPLGPGPSARVEAAAVYDGARDRMLVIGGRDSTGPLDDVWALSLQGRMKWQRLRPAGTSPGARSNHTATLDPEHDRILVFGGQRGYFEFLEPDVWQLTLGPTLAWSRLTVTGPRPSARAYHSAVYAPDLHAVVVLGGLGLVDMGWGMWVEHDSTDVWLLSTGGAAEWTNLTPRISGAPMCGFHAHAAAYDAARSRMLVVDGESWWKWWAGGGCPMERSSTWSLSLRDLEWSALPPGSVEPGRRACATTVPDGDGGVILFGGEDSMLDSWGQHCDVWRLRLDEAPTWSLVVAAAPPSPGRADGQSAIYDPLRDRVLLLERGTLWSRSTAGDEGWVMLPTTGEAPPLDPEHVVVYDSKRDRLVVHGGMLDPWTQEDRVWALTLTPPMTWSLIEVAGDAPSRSDAAAIYDPVRDRLIVYGGWSYSENPWVRGDVWALNLGGLPAWERIAPDRGWSSSRACASAIYDPARDRMVVFGGGVPGGDSWSVHNDVWALPLAGESTWVQLAADVWQSSSAPERRALQGAVYDEISDRMVIVGGFEPGAFADGPWNDAWSFDLSSLQWTRLAPLEGPAPVWSAPLVARDTRRHATVVMEGLTTWVLQAGPGRSGGRASGPYASAPTLDVAPLALALGPARPNPAAGPFTVEFSLANGSPASLELLDVGGRRVWSRGVGALAPGRHVVTVDAARAPVGLYWLRLAQDGAVRTLKVVRIR